MKSNAPFDAPSKSQRKRDMKALQELGERLAALSPEKLAQLDLPETLADAIAAAASIKKFEARRRQMQYVGKLMRDVDPEPIRAFLDAMNRVPAAEKAKMAQLENWRDRLLAEPGALEELRELFPELDAAAWQKKIAAVKNGGDTPAGKLAFRALFRELKKLFP